MTPTINKTETHNRYIEKWAADKNFEKDLFTLEGIKKISDKWEVHNDLELRSDDRIKLEKIQLNSLVPRRMQKYIYNTLGFNPREIIETLLLYLVYAKPQFKFGRTTLYKYSTMTRLSKNRLAEMRIKYKLINELCQEIETKQINQLDDALALSMEKGQRVFPPLIYQFLAKHNDEEFKKVNSQEETNKIGDVVINIGGKTIESANEVVELETKQAKDAVVFEDE